MRNEIEGQASRARPELYVWRAWYSVFYGVHESLLVPRVNASGRAYTWNQLPDGASCLAEMQRLLAPPINAPKHVAGARVAKDQVAVTLLVLLEQGERHV